MPQILFIGPPGAGKGTQAKTLSEKLNIPHISTGAMFREMYSNKSELGVRAAEEYWLKGNLVPDELTTPLVKERLSYEDCKNGFILDGFPRTLPQAMDLDKFASLDNVIYLHVPDEMIIKRLGSRRQCKSCGRIYGEFDIAKEGKCCGSDVYLRNDDKKETVEARLKEYKIKTEPLVRYYLDYGKITPIDGSRDKNKIFEEILREVSLPNHYSS